MVQHPLGALDGGLKGDSPGDFWVLGSYASKASSYHFTLEEMADYDFEPYPQVRAWADRISRRGSYRRGILDWWPSQLPDSP